MIALSFNTGHMSEERMAEFLSVISIPGPATFFCTDRYKCLEQTEHEIGVHPRLLPGGDWTAELTRVRHLFPEAVGYRAHSCLFSRIVAEWLHQNDFKYVSVHDNIGHSSIGFVYHPWGVWHLPIYYLDTLDFSGVPLPGQVRAPFSDELIDVALKSDALFVFAFHPIHLLLNTPNRHHYFEMRDRFKGGDALNEIAFRGEGTRSYFERLSALMRTSGFASATMKNCLDRHIQKMENGRTSGDSRR